MLKNLIELSRPKDWVKNAFVFMPLPFSLASGATLDPWRFALGLVGFSLATSAIYALNDTFDAERDRMHPRKRHRPVASGRLSERAAKLWSLTLFVAGVALAQFSGSLRAVVILLIYVALNAFYCLRGKHVPLLDVFLLSSGFVLRVLLGCALMEVEPSNWLLLCSSTLALFLALAKRWADLAKGVDDSHRPSLAGYNVRFLDQAMGVMTGMTLMSYALYCMEAEVLRPGREFASLPFVVLGVLEYLRLVHVRGEDGGGSPVDLLLSSPIIIFCGAGWIAATIWSVRLL
ncbi:MAG: UbiA prenyltransferase family protein [bacterium]|nr:UbiA prenyltransferase family protein [bacterium]